MLNYIIQRLITLPGIVIGLSLHEFGHAKVAQLCGDRTAEYQGRVTLDPFAHIDWAGMLMLFLFRFGWGKPVMINPRNFKNPRRDSIFVGLAGVCMNLITAFVFAFIMRACLQFAPMFFLRNDIGNITMNVLQSTVIINISLMLFNLIPIPPLDGFGVISEIIDLPRANWELYAKIRQYAPAILMLLIITGATQTILGAPLIRIYNWIIDIAFIGL